MPLFEIVKMTLVFHKQGIIADNVTGTKCTCCIVEKQIKQKEDIPK